MKHKEWMSWLTVAAMSFVIGLGAAGCLLSGFDLKMEHIGGVVLTCGFFAAFSALCFRRKWGGTVLLCLIALCSGFLWHRGQAAEQVLALLYHISRRYDGAYGWGVFPFWEYAGAAADYPVGIIGCVIATTISWTVCRRKTILPAMLLSVLPLAACLVVTDTVPAVGCLFLLLLGTVVLLLTASVFRDNREQGCRLAAMVALPVAAALGLVFLLIPKESYVNQSGQVRQQIIALAQRAPQLLQNTVQNVDLEDLNSSEAKEVLLSAVGRQVRRTYPVMEVTAEQGGTLYLRGQDYDVYDGTGWTASQNRQESFAVSGTQVGEVTIRTLGSRQLQYLPYYPAGGVELQGGSLENRLGREYSFTRTVLSVGWQTQNRYLSLSHEDSRRYLALPKSTRSGAEPIAASVAAGKTTNTAIAQAIGAYVKSAARYDLDTGRMPHGEEDFALWFLRDSETGYCVHFATASVVLLRAAGVPARYVSGYMVQAVAGETVTVTADSAHAWAEYYEPRAGAWIVLESTPADLGEGAVQAPSTVPMEEAAIPATEQTQTQQHQTGETAPQPQQSQPSQGQTTQQNALRELNWLKTLMGWLVKAALAALALLVQRYLRVLLRKSGQKRGSPNAQALARWREASRLSWLLGESPSGELEQLAQKAKFSNHTLTEQELRTLDGHLRSLRQRLRQRPWYLRLIYRYVFATD